MQAAIFREAHQPLTIESVAIDKPKDREVLIRTVATGVCHSDLHFVDGHLPHRGPPMVLGHEGAGVVEAVGQDVTTVAPGDHVVACLSGFCGTCEQCLSGHPNLCSNHIVSRGRQGTPRLSQNEEPLRPSQEAAREVGVSRQPDGSRLRAQPRCATFAAMGPPSGHPPHRARRREPNASTPGSRRLWARPGGESARSP